MLQPLDSSECARQSVRMEDTESDDRSIIPNRFFCGDLIPNFPGPSTFVSGNLSMCTFIQLNLIFLSQQHSLYPLQD